MADPRTARCLHCKRMVVIQQPQPGRMKNGRHLVKGTCPTCQTPVQKIVKTPT